MCVQCNVVIRHFEGLVDIVRSDVPRYLLGARAFWRIDQLLLLKKGHRKYCGQISYSLAAWLTFDRLSCESENIGGALRPHPHIPDFASYFKYAITLLRDHTEHYNSRIPYWTAIAMKTKKIRQHYCYLANEEEPSIWVYTHSSIVKMHPKAPFTLYYLHSKTAWKCSVLAYRLH